MNLSTLGRALALALGLATTAVAQEPATQPPAPPPALADRPDRAAYPDADGVILREVVEVTIADGKVTRRRRTLTTVLRENMMRAGFCDPRIRYDASTETVDVAISRTWMADGTPVETDPKVGRIEVTPAPYAKTPDYTNRRELVVVHAGVEHGATMELDYTIRANAPTDGADSFAIPLAGPLPIVRQIIRVRVPEGEVIALHADGVEIAPAKTTADGFDTFTLERENVAAINVDEAGAHAPAIIPMLVASRIASWADVGARLAKRVQSAAVATDRITSRVASLTEGLETRRSRVAVIHRFVADQIRTVPWALGEFGFAVRPAGTTAESAYGHALDKAVLLHAMLREAGIGSAVAIASRTPRIAAQVPSPAQLDRVHVVVEDERDRWWLDPLEAHALDDSRSVAGCAVLRLVSHGASIARIAPAESGANATTLEVTATIDADGEVHAEFTYDVRGAENPYAALRDDRAAAHKMLERVAERIAGARLGWTATAHLDATRARFRGTAYGGQLPAAAVGAIAFRLPDVADPLATIDVELFRSSRTTPLALPRTGRESSSVTVSVPAGMTVAYRPVAVAMDNAVGSYRVEVRDVDGGFTVRRTLVLKTQLVDPKDYPALRALLAAARARRNTVVLLAPGA